MQAIAEEVEERGRELGQGPLRTEGEAEAGWVVMDYETVVVHIFTPAHRAFYDLEELWKEAPLVVSLQ
jgi:ribosome-associated protein